MERLCAVDVSLCWSGHLECFSSLVVSFGLLSGPSFAVVCVSPDVILHVFLTLVSGSLLSKGLHDFWK